MTKPGSSSTQNTKRFSAQALNGRHLRLVIGGKVGAVSQPPGAVALSVVPQSFEGPLADITARVKLLVALFNQPTAK